MKFYILLLAFILLQSCNADDSTTQTSEASEDSTNTSVPDTTIEITEPLDSMQVGYGGVIDTIYGERKGSVLIVDGDILFDYPERIGWKQVQGVGTFGSIWPLKNNMVAVPYIINKEYKQPELVKAAMKLWEEKSGFIQFVSKTSNDRDYIEFIPSIDNQSYVGRRKKYQPVELTPNASLGIIVHELGHCLGLYHEQMRKDRDNYVLVTCKKNKNYVPAIEKDDSAKDIGPYNFFSIMHYPPSSCMRVKITGLPAGIPGQRDSLTKDDIESVRTIYFKQ